MIVKKIIWLGSFWAFFILTYSRASLAKPKWVLVESVQDKKTEIKLDGDETEFVIGPAGFKWQCLATKMPAAEHFGIPYYTLHVICQSSKKNISVTTVLNCPDIKPMHAMSQLFLLDTKRQQKAKQYVSSGVLTLNCLNP